MSNMRTFANFVLAMMFVPLAYGASVSGDIHGIVRNSVGRPVPGADIIIHSVNEKLDRTVVSGKDGFFLVETLAPGRYRLTASKQGYGSSKGITVEIAQQESLDVDVTLASAHAAEASSHSALSVAPAPANAGSIPSGSTVVSPSQAQSVTASPDNAPLTEREKLLLDRIDQLEKRLSALEVRQTKEANPVTAPAQVIVASADKGTMPASAPVQARLSTRVTEALPASVPAQNILPSPDKAAAQTAAPAKPALAASNDDGVAEGWKSPNAPAAPAATATTEAAATTTIKAKIDPFSDWDWTWLNGNPRTKDVYWDSKFFTPEIRTDTTASYDNQHPSDHSMGGSSELFRSSEVQLEQLGIGGDFHWDNVRGRFMTQFGAYSTATIRNDGSYTHGEWNVADADRYLSEAYGGYHFNVWNGINVDAGIFMSYIGLFSYYNFDNWAYQPSYVSSNTPWFFQGVRIQIFPTAHLKIEPWFVNGWQSYTSSNNRPGLGGQIKWTPFPWLNIISNNYGQGRDDLYIPQRARIHTDNSQEVKYYEKPTSLNISKMAFTVTEDIGCEYGGGVSCTGNHAGGPKQSFIGFMAYNRFWFHKDLFGLTLGGGEINNPGRYLVLLPPINGETAGTAAINSPYFTENPGDPFKAWDSSITFDYMPKQYITFRVEADWRHANVPYWSGHGGITPPAYAGISSSVVNGNGYPTEYACNSGAPSGFTDLPDSQTACATQGGVWFPSLVKSEFVMDFDIMVKF